MHGDPVDTAEPYDVQQPGKDSTFYPVLIETQDTTIDLSGSSEHVDAVWVPLQDLETYLTENELIAFERFNVLYGRDQFWPYAFNDHLSV